MRRAMRLVLVFIALSPCLGAPGRPRRGDDVDSLAPVVAKLSQDMASVQATLQGMRNQLDDAIANIGFHVRLSNFTVNGLTHGQTLKFNDVHFNAGNGYDQYTGMFTAPLPGTYVIFLEVMADTDKDPYTRLGHIMRNGRPVGTAFANNSPYDNGSNLVVLHLYQGDHVCVDIDGGDSITGGEFTNFSGFRLSPI